MLKPGTRLGPYEILAQLGAGGMGEVYKARDTRLDRFVAIKILPEHLADNPDLRERFEREARSIAKLNHPHICTLYDIGRQDGTNFLVMEYLEGETLSARLKKGPLPLDQVLRYAVEISDALDKAHRAGITHRDIKPANVIVTPMGGTTGTKLLDFGLAKLKQEVAKATIPASEMPTVPGELTEHGTLLGTLHYMAPEQVEGKVNEIDARTDIFAFGALVYEMATGKKTFPGETQASVIAKILEVDPPPMSSLQPMTPPTLHRVVKKCLAKDPARRWQSANDLHDELVWIKEGGAQAGMPAPLNARHKLRERVTQVVAAALLICTALLGVLHFREAPPEQRAARFFVLPPENTSFTVAPSVLAISPDGTRLAFTGTSASGGNLPQLWVRPVDSLSAQLLPGTEGATQPFWSPDSRSIAFFSQGKLKKIDVTGGPPQVLCDAAGAGVHGSWNQEGVIVFATYAAALAGQGSGPINRVSAPGGTPTAITTVDATQGETGHNWPHFLPDGKNFLYLAINSDTAKSAIRVGSLDSNESKLLLNAHSFAQYAPPGYLLFQRDGTLMVQALNADALELTGEAFPIAEKVQVNPANGRTAFSVSQNGVLAYRSTGNLNTQLAWFDRSGKELGRIGEPGGYISPKLSPDEKQIAVTRTTDTDAPGDIWVFDLSRNTETRFTFDAADDYSPIWSPDGSRIAFASSRGNSFGLYQKNSNGIGAEELLVKTSNYPIPEDWSLDGRHIVYMSTEGGGRDVLVLPLTGDPGQAGTDPRQAGSGPQQAGPGPGSRAGRDQAVGTEGRNLSRRAVEPVPFLQTQFLERHAQLSPDSRWMAYTSDESGQYQIYVQSFPAGSGKWQVSTSGGIQPRWRRDGKELFYLPADGKLMAVPVRAGATFETGTPALLFQTQLFGLAPSAVYSQQYDVVADGQRFLLNVDLSEATTVPITVVLNWTAGLRR